MAKSFGDYLSGAGYFLLDATREAVVRHEDETVQQEREAGFDGIFRFEKVMKY